MPEHKEVQRGLKILGPAQPKNPHLPGKGILYSTKGNTPMSDSIIATPNLTGILDNRDDRGRDHLVSLLHHASTSDRHNGELAVLRELADVRRELADRAGDVKDKLCDIRKEVCEVKDHVKDEIRREVGAVKDLIKDLDRERIKDELQLLKLKAACCPVAVPV